MVSSSQGLTLDPSRDRRSLSHRSHGSRCPLVSLDVELLVSLIRMLIVEVGVVSLGGWVRLVGVLCFFLDMFRSFIGPTLSILYLRQRTPPALSKSNRERRKLGWGGVGRKLLHPLSTYFDRNAYLLELLFSQAGWGVPPLYSIGALCMGLMVIMVWGYVRKFGVDPSLMKANKKKKVRQ